MKKITVLFGKRASGKTITANHISWAFERPIKLHGRDYLKNDRFFLDSVRRGTDLLVVDDVPQKYFMEVVFMLWGILVVEAKGEEPFEMEAPKAIISITCEKEFFDELGASIHRRCRFIELITLDSDPNVFDKQEYEPGITQKS